MEKKNLDWINIVFLSLTPVIGVLGTAAYAVTQGVRWWEPALLVSEGGAVPLVAGEP